MRAFGRPLTTAAMLILLASMAAAADIRVLGVETVESAIRGLVSDFRKETGHQVIFTAASPAAVMERIKANEIHDAVIVSEPVMDELDRDGIVNPESRVRLAVGPAPDAPQGKTTYEGGVMSDGSAPEAARAFIRFLASADARDKWIAAKLEPLPDH
jgi:ABC-type molybdate transport system substrate-binding protein